MADHQQVRKPKVIDINAIVNPVLTNAPLPPVEKKYTYGAHTTAASAPLTNEEKNRLAQRRAEIAAEEKAKDEAAAALVLQQRAKAVVDACAPADDEDEEEVLRRLEAVQNKLQTVQEVFTMREDGHEDGYRTWLSADRYKKAEAQRLADMAKAKSDAIAAEEEADRRWVAELRARIVMILDNIEFHLEETLKQREQDRVAGLDKALQDEAAMRILQREAKEAEAVANREAFERQLFGSHDPLIEAMRKASHERLVAFQQQEADAEAAEEAALEAKLARLQSLRRAR